MKPVTAPTSRQDFHLKLRLLREYSEDEGRIVKRKQPTFGQIIAGARYRVGLNLRDAANLIKKEDGEPISYQYLNDLEKDRRNPPVDHLIDEIARVYGISRSYLYLLARRIPSDFPVIVEELQAEAAYREFRKRLEEYAAA